MFTLGDQMVSPLACPRLYSARASAPTASPTRRHSPASNAAAVRITCGKLVTARTVPLKRMPRPQMERPWSPSDHHSYAGTPSRATPAARSPSWDTFSASVRFATRSAARCSAVSHASQNRCGCCCWPCAASDDDGGGGGPHEYGGSSAMATRGYTGRISRRSTRATAMAAAMRKAAAMSMK
ncbi:Os11g0291201 [Oryza sativa Japonica Group]|uniref:Os11g0291201 protein n=1 Tax=Oryza sativa subsp. japonica TaxID=39947 RepID=A0A0P0Y235_ORYSJ|nr:hypothetical protein EE612_054841 [Oryza sativa]BAT13632.1 Os11g0291201 [Oryza sativa Japonica Group]